MGELNSKNCILIFITSTIILSIVDKVNTMFNNQI